MSKPIALFIYIVFYLICIIYFSAKKREQNYFLIISFVILTFCVGSRTISGWSDTLIYQTAFYEITPESFFSGNYQISGYSEKGFILLGVFVKLFSNNSTVYFTVIAGLTYFLLYSNLKKYSVIPLLGLCIYLARFMTGREMTQIRSAIAIVVVLWGTQYVVKKEYWKSLLLIIVGYYLHSSMIIALPVLFFKRIVFSKKQIVFGLLLSFIVAGLYGGAIKDLVSHSEFANEWARSYVREDSDKAFSNDLTNPVIYYQCIILLVYTFMENKLSKLTPYYYIIRNCYFYCTVILIVLCQFAVLAARTSTIFATFEVMMIPLIVCSFKPTTRHFLYYVIGFIYSIMFYLNWSYH